MTPSRFISVLGVEEDEEEFQGDDMNEMEGPNPGIQHKEIMIFNLNFIRIIFQAPLTTFSDCFIPEFPAEIATVVTKNSDF